MTRARLLEGATTVTKAMCLTFGPRATSTEDALAIAARAELDDPIQHFAARAIARACHETRRAVADGAVTTALLAEAVLASATRRIASGADATEVAIGIQRAARIALDVIEQLSHASADAARRQSVPGAGFVFLRAIAVLELEEPHFFGDVKAGNQVVREALEVPTRALAQSCELDPDVVVARMRDGHGALGIDVASGAYVDLVTAGIFDSAPTLTAALTNGVRAATALLLDDVVDLAATTAAE